MSRSVSPWVEYKCFHDCSQRGCPGHKVRANYHNTSDILGFDFEWRTGEIRQAEYLFDPDQWKAMTEAEKALP